VLITSCFWLITYCVAQNRNWTLYTALVTSVNAEWGPDEVSIKYLEKGHTYLQEDSIHGLNGEKNKKNKKNPQLLINYINLCEAAGKSIRPIPLTEKYFHEFEGMQRARKSKTKCDAATTS